MKKIKWILVLMVVFIIGVLIGTPSKIEPEPPVPSELKEFFIEGCMDEGANYTYCNCTYSKIINDYGEEALIEMSLQIEGDGLSQKNLRRVTNVVSSCLKVN